MKDFFISIEGLPGSGKSTLIEKLQEKSVKDVFFITEPVEKWINFRVSENSTALTEFYRDMEKNAFAFQMLVATTRNDAWEECVGSPSTSDRRIFISERSLNSDSDIFAKSLSDKGFFSNLESAVYENFVSKNKPQMDAIIYLRASVETCLERVAARNREGEESLTSATLHDLFLRHEIFAVKQVDIGTNVLVLNVEDFANCEEIRDRVLTFFENYKNNG